MLPQDVRRDVDEVLLKQERVAGRVDTLDEKLELVLKLLSHAPPLAVASSGGDKAAPDGTRNGSDSKVTLKKRRVLKKGSIEASLPLPLVDQRGRSSGRVALCATGQDRLGSSPMQRHAGSGDQREDTRSTSPMHRHAGGGDERGDTRTADRTTRGLTANTQRAHTSHHTHRPHRETHHESGSHYRHHGSHHDGPHEAHHHRHHSGAGGRSEAATLQEVVVDRKLGGGLSA